METVSYPYTRTNFMGKEITYSEPTHYREYAVRLRALVDNPRNPSEHLEDWAIDSPSEIVEEGSNSNGEYKCMAGGEVKQLGVIVSKTTSLGGWDYRISLPIRVKVIHYQQLTNIRRNSTIPNSYLTAVSAEHSISNFHFSLRGVLFYGDNRQFSAQGLLYGMWY